MVFKRCVQFRDCAISLLCNILILEAVKAMQKALAMQPTKFRAVQKRPARVDPDKVAADNCSAGESEISGDDAAGSLISARSPTVASFQVPNKLREFQRTGGWKFGKHQSSERCSETVAEEKL